MTQKERKDLLLQDLSSRLPYGVKIDNMGEPSMLVSINNKYRIIVEIAEVDKNPSFDLTRLDVLEIEDAIPYLFPLYSMTKKQKEEFDALYWEAREKASDYSFDLIYSSIKSNWLYKNKFDVNGLIPLGLAKDATGLNIY